MSKVEIISLIVSIIALVSLCAVFTIFLINFCKKSISDIKLGRQDEDIIISEIERRKKEQSKNSKTRKVFKKIGSISFIVFVALSLSYALFAKITERQMVFNSKSLAVASGSMSYKNEVNTYLDDIDNPLEPLKLQSALQSEIFKFNYRKEHKPQDINILDYTIMYALKHCLAEQLKAGASNENNS